MTLKVALAGNPNSGKTTLFNALTGSDQRVGNWPGVTVDKKEGLLKGHKDIVIQDLPGIYSLSPYTMEEVVSRKYLIDEKPDLIINLVDGSNLIRNLYLTSQLAELDIPMIISLNMMDIVREKGDDINIGAMEEILNARVIETVASKEEGIEPLIEEVLNSRNLKNIPNKLEFEDDLEDALYEIEKIIKPELKGGLGRYYAIKVFEEDSICLDYLKLADDKESKISKIRKNMEEKYDDEASALIIGSRYDELEKVSDKILESAEPKLSMTDKIDRVVTSKLFGLPTFALVMFMVFFLAVFKYSPGTMATEAVNGFFDDSLIPGTVDLMEKFEIHPVLASLVSDGVLAGVGAVLGFLPQMMVLFALLSILEDIGYMSRIAFIMDRLFRKFGLSGKSFIPAMVATGCAVPGIQASRTIENERDRKITIMTTSFMPCSAKLPVIALIVGAFFPENRVLVTFSFYVIGILSIIVSGLILKKFKELADSPSPFIMELPPYHAPRPKSVLTDVYNKSKSYVKKAGSIILVSTIVIWFLLNFDFRLNLVGEASENSILARVGSVIAVIFRPTGFGTWQATAATITGFVAKENLVATMGIVLGLGGEVTEESQALLTAFSGALASPVAGYSFLLFNMLCMPCFAAVGAIKTEMDDSRWTALTICYQMGFAYLVSLIFYQLGSFFFYGEFDLGTVVGFIGLAFFIYMVVRKPYAEKKQAYEKCLA